MKSKPAKCYWEMNAEELRVATAEFDRESPPGRFRPMTSAERAQWNRIKRKPGRPKVGQGVEVVSISIERGLLGRADKLAKKLKVSRAKLASAGLQGLLGEVPGELNATKAIAPASPRRVRRKAA